MSLLEISQLNAFYGDMQALFNVDMQVEAGEVIALVGANGAGKSTLMNLIAGNVASKRGDIKLDGESIINLRSWDIITHGIALVPEGRRLFPSLTVEENLLMGAYAQRRNPRTLKQIYDIFPQLGRKRKNASTALSGGEQQMVAIGRALISSPRLLMCDELSLGLAPVIVQEIYKTLGTIRETGLTMIIVEQNVSRALSFADRAYCMLEGRISLHGRCSELTQEQVSEAYFGIKAGA